MPKLVHTPASNEAGEKESQGPTIYAQSATDISAGEDDDSERQRKASIPLTINTKARFLEVPQNPEQGQEHIDYFRRRCHECGTPEQCQEHIDYLRRRCHARGTPEQGQEHIDYLR